MKRAAFGILTILAVVAIFVLAQGQAKVPSGGGGASGPTGPIGTTGPAGDIGGCVQSIYDGTGSPEAVLTALIGSLYLQTDGTISKSIWAKESGTGNTGWRRLSGTVYGTNSIDLDGTGLTVGVCGSAQPITVTGAAIGDVVNLGPPSVVSAGITLTFYVNATDTVTVTACCVITTCTNMNTGTWAASATRP